MKFDKDLYYKYINGKFRIFKNLNEKQKEAVLHMDGPL